MKYLLALLHEHLNSQWIFAKHGIFLQWFHLCHERSLTGSGRGCSKIIRVGIFVPYEIWNTFLFGLIYIFICILYFQFSYWIHCCSLPQYFCVKVCHSPCVKALDCWFYENQTPAIKSTEGIDLIDWLLTIIK